MKRIKVAPRRFVTISTELAEKAARLRLDEVFTEEQLRAAKVMEASTDSRVLLGAKRPGMARRRQRSK